ncbi:hypothetical protein LguiA_006047 [Lonicera macranthoides]
MEANHCTPYDKEYMKMAMLKHEETFREQVYELHRLYQIQKKLMRDFASSTTQNANQSINMERSAEECTEELDESAIELTLGPSSFRERRISNETTMNSDSAPSFSSSSSGSSHIMRTNSGNFHQNRAERTSEGLKQKWGLESNPSFLSGRRNRNEAEEEFRRDNMKQSPWLFQVLSLNMT